jgi:hypothetical protein
MKMTNLIDKLAKLYIDVVVRLYGIYPCQLFQIGILDSHHNYIQIFNVLLERR